MPNSKAAEISETTNSRNINAYMPKQDECTGLKVEDMMTAGPFYQDLIASTGSNLEACIAGINPERIPMTMDKMTPIKTFCSGR